MSQNPEWLMSNPIGSRYSLCQQNKFTIQMRSYHVITFYKTVLPGTSISSSRVSLLYAHMTETINIESFWPSHRRYCFVSCYEWDLLEILIWKNL